MQCVLYERYSAKTMSRICSAISYALSTRNPDQISDQAFPKYERTAIAQDQKLGNE